MPTPLIPKTLPLPPLHHKPQPSVQLHRPSIPRVTFDPDAMQARDPEAPIQSPQDRLATVTLPLVRSDDVDADVAVAVVLVAGLRFGEVDAADGVRWGLPADSGEADDDAQ